MRVWTKVLLCLAVAGCSSTGTRKAGYNGQGGGRCDGEEFVEVANRGENDVEVYAATGGEVMSTNRGVFVGTAGRGTSRIALTGTVAAGRGAGFYASYNGNPVSNVTFRRGCDRRP